MGSKNKIDNGFDAVTKPIKIQIREIREIKKQRNIIAQSFLRSLSIKSQD